MSRTVVSKLLAVLVIASFVIAACQPQTIIETVVVTEIVEKEGATQIVEKVVEVEKVVTPTAEPATPEPEPGEVQTADVIRYAILSDLDGTNVWYLFDTAGASFWNYVVQNTYWPTLFGISDKRWDWIPVIADGFPENVVQEGEFYVGVAKIKSGVTWSDGSQITAADVAFTADIALSFRLQGNWVTAFNPDYLDRVETVDDLTIKYFFTEMPGIPVWQYGALIGPVVNKAYWEPKVTDLLTQAKALDPNSATYVDDLGVLTQELENLENEGEPIAGYWTMKRWEVGAYAENQIRAENWFNGLHIEEYANGAYREYKEDGSYEFSAYGDPTGDKTLDFAYGPYFQSALFSVYDLDAAVLALRNNDVDFILNPSGLSTGIVNQLTDDPNVTVVKNAQNGFRYIEFNQRRPYFAGDQGRALRQAIACQLDLDFLANAVLQGSVVPVYTLVPSGLTYWHNPEVPVFCQGMTTEERLNEAIRILTEAGYTWDSPPSYTAGSAREAGVVYGEGLKMPDGAYFPEITLQAPAPGYDPLRATSAVYIEQWMKQLGIPVTAIYTPFNTIRANENAYEYDIIMLGWGLTSFPSYLCDFFYGTTGVADGSDNTGWINPEYNAKCNEFALETDFEKSRALAFELQVMLANDLPYITLFTNPIYDAYRNVDYPYTEVFDGIGPGGIYGGPHLAIPVPAQQ